MTFNLSRIAFCFAIIFIIGAFAPGAKEYSRSASAIDTISRAKFKFERQFLPSAKLLPKDFSFPDSFSDVEGVTTFRGGPYRNKPSYGVIENRPKSLIVNWSYTTGYDAKWGGGAGWTGQPCIIKWKDSVRAMMNLLPASKSNPNFKEVILGSLDGKIYFLGLDSGKPSRASINIKNPIKGTVSIDPRGWPLLYSGQGISNTGEFGVHIFSLIDQQRIYFLNGRDAFAHRAWSAFDGSPLIHAGADIMFLSGENGLVYSVQLNSQFKMNSPFVSIKPDVKKYRYQYNSVQYQGIESSLAGYKDKLYFCDNHGFIQCLSVDDLNPVWISQNIDDSDATLVLEEENGIPFLYTGNEVDLQGMKGFAHVKKLNGDDGSTVWQTKYECFTVKGAHPVNGGMLSTPVIGKQKGKDVAVFSISRYKTMNKGLLIALKKSSGEKAWEALLDNYAWSSPLDIYDKEGNMYIFLADSGGYVMLFDGANGALIFKSKIASLFEASPAAFNNKIVIASRPNQIFCLEVQ